MQLTPSSKSAFVAGSALSIVGWISMFKLDELAKLFKVSRFVSQERIFTWIDSNRSLTLLFTEFINFGVHGVSNSESVTFALGSTVTNAIMIFAVLPFRMARKRAKMKGGNIYIVEKRQRRAGHKAA